jgi:hypothetical protein
MPAIVPCRSPSRQTPSFCSRGRLDPAFMIQSLRVATRPDSVPHLARRRRRPCLSSTRWRLDSVCRSCPSRSNSCTSKASPICRSKEMRLAHSLASPIAEATARRSSETLWPRRDEPHSHSLCPSKRYRVERGGGCIPHNAIRKEEIRLKLVLANRGPISTTTFASGLA